MTMKQWQRVTSNLLRKALIESSRLNWAWPKARRLMVAVYPARRRYGEDLMTLPHQKQEAASIVARLQEPVAMMSEDGELLALVRPSKSA